MDASQALPCAGPMLGRATPRAYMLGGVRDLAVSFGRIELEGDAERDSWVGAEREFAIKVTRVCQRARQRRVFGTIAELVSCALAAEAEGSRTGRVIFGLAFPKGRFGIRGSKTEFA